jgi:hypothetical protein
VRQFTNSEPVRLVKELPELDLSRDQVGVVRGKWEAPTLAYEVEFNSKNKPLRVLVLDQYLKAA